MSNPRLYTRVAIVLMRVSAETLAGACAAYSARRSMASGVVCCVSLFLTLITLDSGARE
jgi:hypothetical protein